MGNPPSARSVTLPMRAAARIATVFSTFEGNAASKMEFCIRRKACRGNLPRRFGRAGPWPILVEMAEFAFHPATIRVRVGQSVTLRFVNRGQISHQFVAEVMRTVPVVVNDSMMRVEVPGLASLRLQPGEWATIHFVPRRRGRF